MKTLLLFAFGIFGLTSCNSEDTGTGNRTYDANTPVEETENMNAANGGMDTTPTTNNNIYNVDSPASKGNFMDTAASR